MTTRNPPAHTVRDPDTSADTPAGKSKVSRGAKKAVASALSSPSSASPSTGVKHYHIKEAALTHSSYLKASATERAGITELTAERLVQMHPEDELERMVFAQMIAIHNACMDSFCIGQSASIQMTALKDNELNRGIKLTKAFATLLDALTRYRHTDPIRPTMRVEKINVHTGGQAIVGNVVPPSRKGD